MPLGTTLLQSPGWNEGEARHGTLGKHVQKSKSSVGAALSARAFALRLGSAAPVGGSKKCVSIPNPGLAPWAMQEYRPYRARFGECVVKIGMGGLCVIIVFGLGLWWRVPLGSSLEVLG